MSKRNVWSEKGYEIDLSQECKTKIYRRISVSGSEKNNTNEPDLVIKTVASMMGVNVPLPIFPDKNWGSME